MYKFSDTLGRPYADTLIEYLDRMQIGYSSLIAHGLEKNVDEDTILEDIESMVTRCFADENAKETSRLIFNRLKEKNNY